jgi:hypothetical protein
VAAALVVAAKFAPVQHAIFPYRYEPGDTFQGYQFWSVHDAPPWLVALAAHGQLEHELSGEELAAAFEPYPWGTEFRGIRHESSGPGRLNGVAYHDRGYLCGVPEAEDRDPTTTPGVFVYGGVWALLFYAFGNSGSNAVIQAAPLVFGFGLLSAVLCMCLRRVHPSHRVRAALERKHRVQILVRAAWWSVPWPAAVVLAHAFFYDLLSADMLTRPTGLLPLALGPFGVAAVWAGGVLGGILTLSTVVMQVARREHAAEEGAPRCCDACGYPLDPAMSRCPECGTPGGVVRHRRRWRRLLAWGAAWAGVVFLLCAPLSFPLVGRLLPESLLPAESLGTPVLPP